MPGLEALTATLDGRTDVRLAYVFGSVATGRAHRTSDVDVAVLLTEQLEAAAGRSIDPMNLATAPPLLAHEGRAQGSTSVGHVLHFAHAQIG